MGPSLKLVGLVVMLLAAAAASVSGETEQLTKTPPKFVEVKHGVKRCRKDWECPQTSQFCCNLTITDFFDAYQFENLFSKRNSPVAHASGFYDYKSFIIASTDYQPKGFCTTGGKKMQMKELAAFLGHIGSRSSCGYSVAAGGPLAWGLCYNREMSPMQDYCDESYSLTYPCSPGAQYHGRGAMPLYWNFNYGRVGEELNVDLLNHPEYIEQNATLAFQAAMLMWMKPLRKGKPSAHTILVNSWKPTKNDTLEKRVPGFGSTMNILYGDEVCGKGEDNDAMNNIISHYLYYLDLLGVGREEAGPHEFLTCAEQKAFYPSSTTSSS
ncbi:unnamed protein product [Cuscuta europaea]|uniref:Glycoside hydrolase family 19 catalytic domain-containing protein n=1 Tax=Cuscuta europaea TaxID=41803 RepID=A0A9P1EID4_CUSEU|nr:unnamed protein product [Cuscuta europaea]